MPINKISIEGNIGSGKSTVISRLCTDLRIPVFLEPVEEWKEWLTLFYQDPSRWGLSFNLQVLLSFHKWKNNNFPAIYERSPISNRYVFTALQHEQGRMNDLELKMFESIYDQLAWTPEATIYIRTDPAVSMERMHTRGRDSEKGVPLEYLTAVHNKYEEVLKNKKNVVVVDGNRPQDEVYQDVLAYVRFFTSPLQ